MSSHTNYNPGPKTIVRTPIAVRAYKSARTDRYDPGAKSNRSGLSTADRGETYRMRGAA